MQADRYATVSGFAARGALRRRASTRRRMARFAQFYFDDATTRLPPHPAGRLACRPELRRRRRGARELPARVPYDRDDPGQVPDRRRRRTRSASTSRCATGERRRAADLVRPRSPATCRGGGPATPTRSSSPRSCSSRRRSRGWSRTTRRWLERFPDAGGAGRRAGRATCCARGRPRATTAARWRCGAAARSSPRDGWPRSGRPARRCRASVPTRRRRWRRSRSGRAGRGRRHQRAARARALGRARARAAALPPGPELLARPPRRSTRRRWSSARRSARPRAPRLRRRARSRDGCASRGRVAVPPRAAGAAARERFEDTDRWVRGRVVAALLDGAAAPGARAGPRRAGARGARARRPGGRARPGGALSLPSG